MAAQKDKEKIEKWWGRNDWALLKRTPPLERVRMFIEWFKKSWDTGPWNLDQFSKTTREML
jgi:hypothetical protein